MSNDKDAAHCFESDMGLKLFVDDRSRNWGEKELRRHYMASMPKNLFSGVCKHIWRRPSRASAQSDQRVCYSFFEKYYISYLATSEISLFYLVSI